MIIVMLGPPGTGKGTVAQFLEGKFSYSQLSTGDLLRTDAASGSALGGKIKPVMDSGGLVNDEIVAQVVANALKEKKAKGFVLDGFPRNLKQAEILDAMLEKLSLKIDLALDIETNEETIIRRLSARRQCSKCNAIYGLDVPPKKKGICDKCGGRLMQRDDDREEVVRKRLLLYKEKTAPLVDYYTEKGILAEVDGNQPLEKIFRDIVEIIEKE